MLKIYTKFKNLFIYQIEEHHDLRGSLLKIFEKKNIKNIFDINETYLTFSRKGVVRGLHGQFGKYSQSKIMYCIKGSILFIAIDLRKNSETYKKIFKTIITSKSKQIILLPKGFANGFISLINNTIVLNLNSSKYRIDKEFGINIESLKLKLPKIKLIFSKKDKKLHKLNNYIKK